MAEDKSHFFRRLGGNMLPVKAVASVVRGTTSFVQLPLYLTQWGTLLLCSLAHPTTHSLTQGDNIPVEPLNVRGRDVVLLGLTLGVAELVPLEGAFAAAFTVNPTSLVAHAAEHAVVHVALDAIEGKAVEVHGRGHHHDFANAERYQVNGTIHGLDFEVSLMNTLRMNVHHKLFSTDAVLDVYVSRHFRPLSLSQGVVSTGPGWFCPWVYSTHRKPLVSRVQQVRRLFNYATRRS